MFTNKKAVQVQEKVKEKIPEKIQENVEKETKEWTPSWTNEGKNNKNLDSELWAYYKRLERLLETNKFENPKGN